MSIAQTQTTVNPDISLIGFFNTFTNDIKNSDTYGKLNFATPGFELLIEGYLNPYARAVATLAFEEEEFSMEELYAEILRGFPLDLQIKAGKYLLGFAKLNTSHPHTWPFLSRPLSQQIYLGPEGFNDSGFDLSFILPFETVYSSITLGLFKGDAIVNTLSAEGNYPFGERGVSPLTVGRWGSFFTLSDYTSLEIGLSGSYGLYARQDFDLQGDSSAALQNESLYYLYSGIDFKYKYVPDLYSALTIQGEAILNQRGTVQPLLPYTVHDVVMMGRYPLLGMFKIPSAADKRSVSECLDRVGISNLQHSIYNSLSGGQRQRTLIARALVARPDVLILDEPTNGMDTPSHHALLNLVADLHDRYQLTVLLVSHLLSDVANLVKKLMLFEPGSFQIGPIEELLSEEKLGQTYAANIQVKRIDGDYLITSKHNN
jgi:ABC-type Mn2+/Zn2+ transport system ATPase subunit